MPDTNFQGFSDRLIALKDYPVESWNPEYCGELPIRIGRDGRWYYQDSPIERERLVELFSRILKKEGDHYYLVTPSEKVGITVEDAPFRAVHLEVEGQGDKRSLQFTTNVGDTITLDADHPLHVDINPATNEPAPYVEVRRGLEAKLCRAVFYELVELAEEIEHDGKPWLAIHSGGKEFLLGPI